MRGDDEDMMGDVGEMWGEGMHEEVDEFQHEIEFIDLYGRADLIED